MNRKGPPFPDGHPALTALHIQLPPNFSFKAFLIQTVLGANKMGIQGGRRNQPLRTRHPDPDFVSVKIKGFTGQINIQGRFIGRQTENYAGTRQELKQAVADVPASNQGQPHILRLMKFRQASTDCGK
ncbi:hypothetical protein H206_05183 [Candidatus Electrothrix aarhusensis]|uniref:Uncharacterized protein n=1 Tax=Candidatus Electrothrix aarhusensis TaxID=1859131 RepID=A0A444J5C6_9BACT|nr:hypothetical protein H206_05183 [Candidatus Electrothrix aarhusensis]